MNRISCLLLAGISGLLAACAETDEGGKFADMIFAGGAIYTVDNSNPWAEAVAIKGDRIVYVGAAGSAARLAGPDTRRIDLDGRMLLPGLIDSHTHIFNGSSSAQSVNLSLADTPEKLAAALQALKDANPGDAVVYARGWQNHLFPADGPRKETLDEVFGDRPVILGSVDGHSTWFSSAAFDLAGVTAAIEDPVPGVSFFERDSATGELLGTTREGAGDIVRDTLLDFDREFYKSALARWLPDAAASGLTAVFDAGAAAPTEEDAYRILAELEADNALTLRVFGSVRYRFGDDDPAARFADMKARHSGAYYAPYSIKLMADGVPEGHTAYLLTPYVDRPESAGEPMTDQDTMTTLITSAYRKDVPVHVHAIGDAAIRLTLNAVESAQIETGNHDVSTAIAHMDFVSTDDIPRFAQLGVVAQTSIQWAARDPSYTNIGAFVGMKRMEAAYPVRSLIEAGAIQSFGADWPAAAYLSTYEPLILIEAAVTRQLPGRADMPVRNPAERIGLADAIAGMTIRAARQLEADEEIGSIEAGKKADLIVLEKNLFEIPEHEIHRVRVLLTMMDGNVIHRVGH